MLNMPFAGYCDLCSSRIDEFEYYAFVVVLSNNLLFHDVWDERAKICKSCDPELTQKMS